MFNLFGSKKEENPISDVFKDLTTNQKKSVINLLLAVGTCDGGDDPEKEIRFLNQYLRILGLRQDSCTAYLEAYGIDRVIYDLKDVSESQKEFLVVVVWDMIVCDGPPNEQELALAFGIFEHLGVSNEKFSYTVRKTKALMEHFFK